MGTKLGNNRKKLIIFLVSRRDVKYKQSRKEITKAALILNTASLRLCGKFSYCSFAVLTETPVALFPASVLLPAEKIFPEPS